MLKGEDFGKGPKGTVKPHSRKIRTKGPDAIPLKVERRRHHHKQRGEAYSRRLEAGQNPTISECKKALNKIPPDSRQEAELRYHLGRANLMSNNLTCAETAYHHAMSLCEKLNWMEEMPLICRDLGYISEVRGKLNDAEKWLLKALEIDEQLEKSTRMAIDCGRLAVIYRRQEELDKAEKMAHRSLRLAKLHDLEELMSRQYNNLGVIYLHQFKLAEAERMLLRGLDIDAQSDRFKGEAYKYYNLGRVHRARQDIKSATEYGNVSKGLFEKLGMQNEVCEVGRFLANIEG